MNVKIEVPSEYEDTLKRVAEQELRSVENLVLYQLLVFLEQFRQSRQPDGVYEEKVTE